MERKDMIQSIKETGQYIVDNAENILGDHKRGILSMKLIATINPESVSTVTVQREHAALPFMQD